MAKLRIGIQLETATAWSTPSTLPPQPHWKTAVSTPYDAAIDSRFITAAFTGTTTERNIIASSSTETETTNPTTTHSRSESRLEMSAKIGVVPVTSTPSGSSARRSVSSSVVRSSDGPDEGSASKTATAPSGVVTGEPTVATPAVAAIWVATAAGSAVAVSTTIVNGPFAPAPYSSATRS